MTHERLTVASSLAAKGSVPASDGTLDTATPTFAVVLVAVILIVGGLALSLVLALGPIAEHFDILLTPALIDSFRKLTPQVQWKNPVMYIFYIGSNAAIIVFLIPLVLKGVKYRAVGALLLLHSSLLIYGLGGLIVPFVGVN